MAAETLTPLVGAVHEIAVQHKDIKQALLLLKANGMKDVDGFTTIFLRDACTMQVVI